ncbi:transposase [Chryseobacterium camelliae]|uniref:transposase n=1 Tax=Chryseobacterium camelliae TaxID=1265445 RepID=UPI000C1C869C|nr:transposase [Chryseobacterium camelliae]
MMFKDIHIGKLIVRKVRESGIEMPRIMNFLKKTEAEILAMYDSPDLETGILLRWSKLLEYDFFRLYSQHLILYAPPSGADKKKNASRNTEESGLPVFRKNIYTQQIISFILEQIQTGKKTPNQVIQEYKIPKTTLYKWISKNK